MQKKTSLKDYSQKIAFFCVLGATLFILSGCGIKPKELSAPDGKDQNAFPARYPAQSHK